MAIGTPSVVALGTGYNQLISSVTTLPAGASVAVGDLILITSSTTNDRSLASVTDSKGNTYTVVASAINGTSLATGMAYATCTAALIEGDTITVTLDRTGGWNGPLISKIPGVATVEPIVDVFGTNIGTGSALSVAAGGPTAVPAEIAVALFNATGNVSWTPGSGWTMLAEHYPPDTSFIREQAVFYRHLSAIETPSASVTQSGSGDWTGIMATFRESGVTPPDTVSGTFLPDAILAQAGLTGDLTALANDPASPDGNWLVVP